MGIKKVPRKVSINASVLLCTTVHSDHVRLKLISGYELLKKKKEFDWLRITMSAAFTLSTLARASLIPAFPSCS